MKNTKVDITIILPVYNDSKYLPQCLDSIFSQTFKDFTVIAIDDASTDQSYEILKKYQEKNQNLQIIRNQKNLGVATSMNLAIKQAGSKYIAIMNSDDIMLEDRLADSIRFLEGNPEYIAVGGQIELIDQDSQIIGEKFFPQTHEQIYKTLLTINPIQHSSMTVNRSKLPIDFNWYREGQRLAEDLDLLFQLLPHGKLYNSPSTYIKYRIHQSSLTQKYPKKMHNIAYAIRVRAIRNKQYRPTFKQMVLLNAGLVIVNLLPQSWVNRLFYMIRNRLT